MEEVKEEVNIAVIETKENNLVDYTFELNTATSGTANHITDLIQGELIAVIIDSSNQIGVNISFEELPGISLFNIVDFFGQRYLSLKTEDVNDENEKYNFSNSNWFLNNKLNITINGPKETGVKFIVRYKNG